LPSATIALAVAISSCALISDTSVILERFIPHQNLRFFQDCFNNLFYFKLCVLSP
jgi:hypothetical protein